MSEKWYAIRVEPGRELSVAEALRLDKDAANARPALKDYLAAEGCELVMPLAAETMKRQGRAVTVTRPALRGYIFRRMQMTEEAYYVICGTDEIPGIQGVIGFLPRGRPLPISEVEIDKLVDTFEERFGESAEEQDLGWMLGKRFTVAAGPFTSFPGECIGFDQASRQPILMVEIFGRLTPVTLPVNWIDISQERGTTQDVAPKKKKAYIPGISKRSGRAR